MAEKVMMIALSPTMEEGNILKWNKREGDEVSSGDVLAEVETDKASMDYESTQEGKLLAIVVGEGESAKVGQTIAVLGEEGEDVSSLVEEAEKEKSAPGGGAAPATAAAAGQVPAETATAQGPGPAAEGAQGAAAGETAPPSVLSGEASTAEGAAPPVQSREGRAAGAATGRPQAAGGAGAGAQAPGAPGLSAARQPGGRVKASPLARKLAEQRNIDISRVSGSGPEGRVVKRDIESFRGAAAGPGPAIGTGIGAGGAAPGAGVIGPGGGFPGENVQIPVTGKRAVIARRLSESKFSAPHYYIKARVKMDGLLEARTELNKSASSKVSLNAFIIKFAAEALKRHPMVNASWQGDHILQFASIDIGLAVDLGNGLITPVVRNCGNKGIVQIDAEMKALIDKVRENKLSREDYSGATFSISNLGSFGIEEFTAIINPPGSAILTLGEVRKEALVGDDDEISISKMMHMIVSCDHRVIDGVEGGRFLKDLKDVMENPIRLIY